MYRVVIMYPKTETSNYNMEYYLNHHLPLIRGLFKKIINIEVDQGIRNAFPDQPMPYYTISYFYFETIEDFQEGIMAGANDIMEDLAKFSNVQPIIQINEIVSR